MVLTIETFDLRRRSCLRPDWLKNTIVNFLIQKYCDCATTLPGCGDDGLKITLVVFRFLTPTEQRYASIEGEPLVLHGV